MNAKRAMRSGFWAIVAGMLAGTLAGCENAVENKAPAAPPEWALNLTVDGAAVKLPLEIMDVFLVEDHAYPESYEIRGTGVTLVGEFPLTIHVDYGENWQLLKSQPIPISGTLDNPNVASQSTLQLPNIGTANVVGGSFTVDSISGEYAGVEGDLTLAGTIHLELQTQAGPKSVSGTFAVHAVTWG
jgi:hypothetical protein